VLIATPLPKQVDMPVNKHMIVTTEDIYIEADPYKTSSTECLEMWYNCLQVAKPGLGEGGPMVECRVVDGATVRPVPRFIAATVQPSGRAHIITVHGRFGGIPHFSTTRPRFQSVC
jgi:hypothetical protein